MLWLLPLFLGIASAAHFGTYFDADCKIPLVNAVVFTDVCTWSSNQFSGSYAMYLSSCSDSELELKGFNLTGAAECVGTSVFTLNANASCLPYENAYVKVLDFTCESQNTTYNVLAHFTPDCQDGGYAFSLDLGQPECLQDSFAPGLWTWDARGGYSDPFYMLELFNSTNGTCQDEVAVFETKEFPSFCLTPTNPFQNISIDIFQAFPV